MQSCSSSRLSLLPCKLGSETQVGALTADACRVPDAEHAPANPDFTFRLLLLLLMYLCHSSSKLHEASASQILPTQLWGCESRGCESNLLPGKTSSEVQSDAVHHQSPLASYIMHVEGPHWPSVAADH